jgi:hypothetical protein
VSLNSLSFYPPRLGARGLNVSMREILVGFASLYPPYPQASREKPAWEPRNGGRAAACGSEAISRVCHSRLLYRKQHEGACWTHGSGSVSPHQMRQD